MRQLPIQYKIIEMTLAVVALFVALLSGSPIAIAGSIVVQSTTSTANSGLYDHLLPVFEATHDVEVKVVAVGTGQALRNARNCDGDMLLVHAKQAEQAFIDEGFAEQRFDLMFNDFILLGPSHDPAGITGLDSIVKALQKISQEKALFASRGDDSGTHKKELSLWQAANIDPQLSSRGWYRELGSGMGATLNTAVAMGAYVISDAATWISFANKQGFSIVLRGDERLYNQYGLTVLSTLRCPDANVNDARLFADWLRSETGQATIGSFLLGGQQLFYPNAQ